MSDLEPQFLDEPEHSHALIVGRDGTFMAMSAIYSLPSHLNQIVERLRNDPTGKLTLYFHGGLNSVARGIEVAREIRQTFDGLSYPVAFLWRTGFRETLDQNLKSIPATQQFRAVWTALARVVLARLGPGAGGTKGPGGVPTKPEAEAILEQDDCVDTLDQTCRTNAAGVDLTDQESWNDEVVAQLQEEIAADPRFDEAPVVDQSVTTQRGAAAVVSALTLAGIAFRVVSRFARGRDHGFRETLVEEILRALSLADIPQVAWDGMKAKAAAMWEPNAGPELGHHVGSYLLDRLAGLQEERPELAIDLVGHSAGSIAICHLLAETPRRPTLHVRNVVLLAPACTVDLFYEQVASQPGRYQDLWIFALRDREESRDRLVRGLYGKSLLYFVSGLLESEPDEPILGLERHTTGQAPYDSPKARAVREILQARGHMIWAGGTDVGSLSCGATTHGGFHDDQTRQSLKAIVSG
jgi:hypothetical protein